jgi:hypothetical protein
MNESLTPGRARWLLACAALVCCFVALAAPPVHSVWTGSALSKGRPVAVTLMTVQGSPGTRGTSLQFGVPRSCRLEAEYSGDKEGAPVYSFTGSTGGFCDQLLDGYFLLRLDASRNAAADLFSAVGGAVETIPMKALHDTTTGRPVRP